jgi:tRNA A37 threonylcarbamoyladenosine biosynthesis protein TsaE
MKAGIVIQLDRSVYLVGNQILSPTFVKSYLEYQSELYHFDMDYVLKIMDDTICTMTLSSDKYILLKEDGYQVV